MQAGCSYQVTGGGSSTWVDLEVRKGEGSAPKCSLFILGSRVPGTGGRTAREGTLLMTERGAEFRGQSSPIQQMLLVECSCWFQVYFSSFLKGID